MKSYPYIGKFDELCGRTVLFYKDRCGTVLDGNGLIHGEGDYCSTWFEEEAKNITAEYLANTYGEVKSKEHAEFIVKLCENTGIEIGDIDGNNINWFSISDNLTLWEKKSSAILFGCKKQITIPLPPECESVDGWPKVGDEVEAKHDSGQMLKGDLLAITSEYAIIQQVGHEQHLHLSAWKLSKPKTPEQELREDIIKTIHDDVYKGAYGKESFEIFADALMAKYNITKKGEADE